MEMTQFNKSLSKKKPTDFSSASLRQYSNHLKTSGRLFKQFKLLDYKQHLNFEPTDDFHKRKLKSNHVYNDLRNNFRLPSWCTVTIKINLFKLTNYKVLCFIQVCFDIFSTVANHKSIAPSAVSSTSLFYFFVILLQASPTITSVVE